MGGGGEGVGGGGFGKGFGGWRAGRIARALRAASENLQGTKPRERARIGRWRAFSYGALAVCGPQLRLAARSAEGWGWRCSSGAGRFCDLRAGVWGEIGVVVGGGR